MSSTSPAGQATAEPAGVPATPRKQRPARPRSRCSEPPARRMRRPTGRNRHTSQLLKKSAEPLVGPSALRTGRDARVRLHVRERLLFLQSYALTGVCACARDALDLGQAVGRPGWRRRCRRAGVDGTGSALAADRVDDLAGGARGHGRRGSGRRDGESGHAGAAATASAKPPAKARRRAEFFKVAMIVLSTRLLSGRVSAVYGRPRASRSCSAVLSALTRRVLHHSQ